MQQGGSHEVPGKSLQFGTLAGMPGQSGINRTPLFLLLPTTLPAPCRLWGSRTELLSGPAAALLDGGACLRVYLSLSLVWIQSLSSGTATLHCAALLCLPTRGAKQFLLF